MDFPCTQQLPDLDETFMSDDDQEKKQVGKLVVQNQSEGNVQEFPILEGENIIGRHSDCDINIEHGVALSKKHACIEVIGGQVVVFDCGSRNKTWIGKMKLKPDVRYAVRDREIIKFANIECRYLQNPETPEKKMKSDSVSSIASLIDATIATPSMKSTLLAVDTPETSTLINKKNLLDVDCIPDSQPVHDSFISESSFSTEVEKVKFDSDEQNINYEVNNNKQSPIHCAIDSEIEESILSSPDSPQISLKLDESVSTRDSFLKFKNVDSIGNADTTVDPIVDTLVDPNVDKTVDTIVDSIVNQTFNTTVDTTVDSIVNTTVDTTVDRPVDTTVDRPVDITVETTVDDSPVKNDKTENFDKKVAENLNHSTDTVEKNVDQLDTEVERSVEQFETSTENVDEKAESTVKNIDGHVETVDEDVEIVKTLVENNSEEEECFKQSQEDIFEDDNDDDETDIEDDFVNNQEQCVFEDPYLAETQVISSIGAENCPGNTGEKILGITEDNSRKDLTKDDDISRDDIDISCGDDESIQKCAEGLVDSDLESDNDVSLLPNTNMIDTQHQHVPQMSGGILSMSCPKDNVETINECETLQDKINDVDHKLEKVSKTIWDKDKEYINEPIENTIINEDVKTSHNEDIKSSHNKDIKVPINEDVMSSHVEEVKSFDVNDEIAKSSIDTSIKGSHDKDIKSSHVEDKSIKSCVDKVCTSYDEEANSSHEGLKSYVEEGLKRSHNEDSNASIKMSELSSRNEKFDLKIASNTYHENKCLDDAGKLSEPEDVDQPQLKLENKSIEKSSTSNDSLKISKPETIPEGKTSVNASKNEISKCSEASIKNTSGTIEGSSKGLLELDGVSNKESSLITKVISNDIDKPSTSMDRTNNINLTSVQENTSLKAPEFSNPCENNVVEDIMAEEMVTNEIITTNSPQNINIQETSHRFSSSPVSSPLKLNNSQISPTKLPSSIGGFPVPKLPILEDSFVDLSPPSPEDEPQTEEYDFTNTENIYANCSTQPFVESDAKRDRLVEEDNILGDLASNDTTTLSSTKNPSRPQASTSTRTKENRKRKPRKTSTKRKRKTVMTTSASPSTLATTSASPSTLATTSASPSTLAMTSTIPLISTSQNIETPVSSSLQPSTSENQFSTTEPSTTALEREPKISSTMSTRKRLARKTQESTVKQTVATKSSKTDINPSTSTSLNEESSAILPSLQSIETENQALTTEPTTANISTTSTAETENLLSTKSTRRRKPRKTSESNVKQQKSKNISGNRKNKSTELNNSTNESKTMSTRSKDVGNSSTVARKETTRRKKIKLEKEQMEIGNTGLNDLTNSEPETKTRRTRKKQISVKQEVQTNDDVVINIAQPELPALNNSEDFETKKERNLEMKPSSHHSLKFETRKRRKQPTVPSGEPHVYSPAKRIKSEIKSAQLALRPRRVKPKIMFTGVVDELGEKIVKDLGGHMTDDVQECTHLITDKIRRTVKFLCALVRGAFILNQDWLRESKMQMRFLPEEDYELTDDNNVSTNSSISSISSMSNHSLEDQFNFNLHQSLQKSRSHSLPLFHNLRIHATKSVLPPPEQMYSIIGCGGGQVMKKMPRSFDDDVIIVASENDSKICATALKVGAKIVSSEFILTGILRQKLEPDNFRLFQDNSTSSKATSSTTRSARVRKPRK